ncbi:MAG: hypothetical protein B6D73_20190 [gamma proteobacterium symbiont of Stewartia floridana]|nr:MAG: hypothetical protein B6D73_20190 [gamma proteobacterium symbiont of Stewartia floridana]
MVLRAGGAEQPESSRLKPKTMSRDRIVTLYVIVLLYVAVEKGLMYGSEKTQVKFSQRLSAMLLLWVRFLRWTTGQSTMLISYSGHFIESKIIGQVTCLLLGYGLGSGER